MILPPTGVYKRSKEQKRKNSERIKKLFADGRVSPMKGRHQTAESKQKMSVSKKKLFASGHVHHLKGTKRSKKSSEKQSVSMKKRYDDGLVHPMTGKHHTTESKKAQSKATKEFLASEKGKELLKKMAKTQFKTGQIPWNKDKPLSEEARMKMIRTMSTPEFRELRSFIRSRIKLPTKDTKPEKILQAFCNSEGIKFQKHKWFNLGFQRAEADLFIEPNICILADGDHYHANPNLLKHDGTMRYPPDRVLHKAYKNKPERTVMDKWMIDDMITKGLKKQKQKVLRFWEYDILNNPEIFQQKIIKIIKESKPTAL